MSLNISRLKMTDAQNRKFESEISDQRVSKNYGISEKKYCIKNVAFANVTA